MAAKARTLTLKTKVEVTGADKLNNLGQKMQSVGKNLTVGVTLPVLGLGGALVAMSEEAARADAELSRTFDSMGAGAFTTIDALKATQQELQSLTTFGDEEIAHLQSVLLTFGNVTGEAFDRGTKAALDMSALLGTDLQSSAIQVGKALNDPIKGVTALTRVGVSFTEQQKEQIRTLTESGDAMGAQNIILGELERQFGGAAEAMAGTAGGQFKQALNALGDAGEEFGDVISPVLKDAADLLKGVAKWLKELDPDTKTWVVRIAALAAALGPVLVIVGGLLRVLAPLKAAFAFFALKDAASGVTGFSKALSGLKGSATGLLGPLGLAVTALTAITIVGEDIHRNLDPIGHSFNELASKVGRSRQQIDGEVNQLAHDLHRSTDSIKEDLIGFLEEGASWDGAVDAVKRGGEAMTDAQREAVVESGRQWQTYNDQISAAMYGTDGAVPTVTGAADDMAGEAGDLPEAMADELLANQFHLKTAIDEMVDFMDQALSPAQEVFNARAFLSSQEYKDGLNSGIPAVRLKAQELGEQAVATLERYSNGYGAGASFSNSFASGMQDPAALAFVDRVAASIGARARRFFPGSEPKEGPLKGITKAWGFTEIFAKGLLSGQDALDRAFNTLLGGGVSMPSLGLVPAGAGAGGAVTTINNFYLQWDGEPPKGRTESEIVSTLQRLHAVSAPQG